MPSTLVRNTFGDPTTAFRIILESADPWAAHSSPIVGDVDTLGDIPEGLWVVSIGVVDAVTGRQVGPPCGD